MTSSPTVYPSPKRRSLLSLSLTCLTLLATTGTARSFDETALERCLEAAALPRVARVVNPEGEGVYAVVLEAEGGEPRKVATLAPITTALEKVFDLAANPQARGASFDLGAEEMATRLCPVIAVSRKELLDEDKIILAAGLNYAAHAEEAGGGDVFLFPKPSPPTSPYAAVHPPSHVTLLDYEVELGFVLLSDFQLLGIPSEKELLAKSAFFVSNDLSDREPIIRFKAVSGPGTGFPDAKGQDGFFPAGPWMVRGTELFAALNTCNAPGLALRLSVDEGTGFRQRQDSDTSHMILQPRQLLERLGHEVVSTGRYSPMPFRSEAGSHHFPFAIGASPARLPAGSIVLTGTPDGVVVQAPKVPGLVFRGLLKFQSPFAQFIDEEKARLASGEPLGYLRPGHQVEASISGLGSQRFAIGKANGRVPKDPCLSSSPSIEN